MKQRRLQLGLSQEAVAEKVGVSVRRYQEIETGALPLNPRLDTLIKYCRVLNLKLEDLLSTPEADDIEKSKQANDKRAPRRSSKR